MSTNISCPNIYGLEKLCVITKSYLRPGPGNTLMPWLIAVLFSFLHFSLLLGRIKKWEKSQYLSLVMAAFTIFLTGLAYASTHLSAETVYVWLPISLSGEVGAVLQLHALMYQDHGDRVKEFTYVKPIWTFLSRISRPAPWIRTSRSDSHPVCGDTVETIQLKENPGVSGNHLDSDTFEGSSRSSSNFQDTANPLHSSSGTSTSIETASESRNELSSKDPSSSPEDYVGDYRGPQERPASDPSGMLAKNQPERQNFLHSQVSLVGKWKAVPIDNSSRQTNANANHVLYLRFEDAEFGGIEPEPPKISNPELVTVFLSAWLVLICLVVLQVTGLSFAFVRLRDSSSNPPMETWCSPGFVLANGTISNSSNPAATTATGVIFDGSCDKNYTVFLNSQGTGCIQVPGTQATWLGLTAIGVSFQLVLQFVDVWLLIHYRNSTGWLNMRPVCTMVSGALVWSTLTIAAGIQTTKYPLVSGMVAIVSSSQQGCQLELDTAGLRGEIIAWADGLFAALGTWYYGPFGMD